MKKETIYLSIIEHTLTPLNPTFRNNYPVITAEIKIRQIRLIWMCNCCVCVCVFFFLWPIAKSTKKKKIYIIGCYDNGEIVPKGYIVHDLHMGNRWTIKTHENENERQSFFWDNQMLLIETRLWKTITCVLNPKRNDK